MPRTLESDTRSNYLSFSGTVGVLESILLSHLLVEHLSLLRRWRRRAVLPLTKVIIIDARRRAIWRMIVVRPGGHIRGRNTRRRPVKLALTLRRSLRCRVIGLLVHVVLLTGIGHDGADKQTGTAIPTWTKIERTEYIESTMELWTLGLGEMTLTPN
jgi:hypothetical protein